MPPRRADSVVGWIMFALVAVTAVMGSALALIGYFLGQSTDPAVMAHKFTLVGWLGGLSAILGPIAVTLIAAFTMNRLQRRHRLIWWVSVVALAAGIALWYGGLKLALSW